MKPFENFPAEAPDILAIHWGWRLGRRCDRRSWRSRNPSRKSRDADGGPFFRRSPCRHRRWCPLLRRLRRWPLVSVFYSRPLGRTRRHCWRDAVHAAIGRRAGDHFTPVFLFFREWFRDDRVCHLFAPRWDMDLSFTGRGQPVPWRVFAGWLAIYRKLGHWHFHWRIDLLFKGFSIVALGLGLRAISEGPLL